MNTYVCKVRNLEDGSLIGVTVEADSKSKAIRSLSRNPHWKAPWKVLKSSWRLLCRA